MTAAYDPAAAPWRTWGSGVVCAATSQGENAGVLGVFDAEGTAEAACDAHNAALDLAWLAGKGWMVQLGIKGSPAGPLEPWEAHLSLQGLSPLHRACGTSPAEVLAKAREWAERQVAS